MEQLASQQHAAMELRDYVGALWRRKGFILLFTVALTIAAAVAAFSMTPLYLSETMISIESQEIPETIVATTVTGYVQERITGLKNRLLTPDNLWEVAKQIKLYPDKLEKGGRRAVLSAMADGIEVIPVDIKFSSQTGKSGTATVAFTISFLADTPAKAQQGAALLAELFISEEQRSRTQQAEEVSRFLAEQAEILRKQIVEYEEKLSEFKQENVPRLPEFVDLNMRLLEQTDEKLARTEERIRGLRERRVFLKAQLATTDRFAPIVSKEGDTVLAPGQRLKLLRTEYLRLSATYSPDHPDISRLRREMEVLENETGAATETVKLIKERERLRAELATIRQRYSSEHPDVRKLQNSIAAMETRIAQAPIKSVPTTPQEEQAPPDNPPFIRLSTELDALEVNIKSELEQRDQLNAKRNELEQRLFQSPLVEKEYLELSRDYQNAVNRYNETKDKLLMAEAAERLETEKKSQRFLLLRAAYLPISPDRPNRLAIVLVGFFLGITGGVSVASVAEYLDQTVKGVQGIVGIFGAPPIATIPYIENRYDIRRRHMRNTTIAIGATLAVLVTVTTLHYLWKPIDTWLAEDPVNTSQQATDGSSGTLRPEGY